MVRTEACRPDGRHTGLLRAHPSRHPLDPQRTAQTIDALYERLSMRQPPQSTPQERSSYTRTKRAAAARGWAPPLAWDDIENDTAPATVTPDHSDVDETALHLVLTGVSVALNVAERKAAIRELNARGYNDHQIAVRVRLDTRSVLRIRGTLGIPAAVGADREAAA